MAEKLLLSNEITDFLGDSKELESKKMTDFQWHNIFIKPHVNPPSSFLLLQFLFFILLLFILFYIRW
jgi:hypothetical protein